VTRSRTPHLDRARAKLARATPLTRFQRRRLVPANVLHDKAVAIARLAKKIRRGRAGPPQADRHRIEGPHVHRCITPTCLKRYRCEQVCDPVDEGLKNSICDDCFDVALSQL
jgi:hypothetical protein